MNYLEKYNLNNEQIEKVKEKIMDNDINLDIFIYDSDKIENILDIFESIGVTNIYGILLTNPSMFCDTISSIKNKIDKYENKEELANLINTNPLNLRVIGLL